MSYKMLTENEIFKTGRRGVVFEVIDNIIPNLMDNNKDINSNILSRYSKFKFTIINQGRAIHYNLDPNEALLLNYLLSDGVPHILKKRLGAYNDLSGQEQIELRNLVQTFSNIDYQRFDRIIDYSTNKESTSITLQKNILDYKSSIANKMIVKKITFSFEEAMDSASKYKITIEDGEAFRDTARGNGLNIIKPGTYKTIDKTYLMLTRGEFIIPIAECAKRVVLAEQAFYGEMKKAQIDFTNRKFENKDFQGKNIDEWNPQGKPKFKIKKVEKTETAKVEIEEYICSGCNATIDSNIYNYSTKAFGKALCFNCQNAEREKGDKQCSDCGTGIDNNVFNYSSKRFNKPLCLPCQKKQ